MTQYLPPNLLALFAPRDPVPYAPPLTKLPHEKKNKGYIGVGSFMKYFEDAEDTPPPKKIETREERLERRRRERAEQVAYKLEQEIAIWDPHGFQNGTVDPFKTLFVARINYDTSESKLRREFEIYGPIRKIVLVHDAISGKPRGYAFIEYEHERDMHSAYKHADGKKIDGRRVLVDVERGRTVKGWLPRRLGGGLGGTRRGGPDVNLKHSGREDNERERERYRLEREASESREKRRGVVADDRERDRRRSRSPRIDRDKERRRRSRTRSRERRRREARDDVEIVEDRRDRDRDRERGDRADRDRDRGDRDRDRDKDKDKDKDKDRKRRRSRSRDRDRDRKKERRDREHRDKDRDRDRKDNVFPKEEKVRVKMEPPDDYPHYNQAPPDYGEEAEDFGNVAVKKEEEVDSRYASYGGQMYPLQANQNGRYETSKQPLSPQPPPAPSY